MGDNLSDAHRSLYAYGDEQTSQDLTLILEHGPCFISAQVMYLPNAGWRYRSACVRRDDRRMASTFGPSGLPWQPLLRPRRRCVSSFIFLCILYLSRPLASHSSISTSGPGVCVYPSLHQQASAQHGRESTRTPTYDSLLTQLSLIGHHPPRLLLRREDDLWRMLRCY